MAAAPLLLLLLLLKGVHIVLDVLYIIFTGEDYFPRIESVRDNLGNLYTPDKGVIETGLILRPDDILTFIKSE